MVVYGASFSSCQPHLFCAFQVVEEDSPDGKPVIQRYSILRLGTTPHPCHTLTTPRPCHVPLPRYPPLSTPYTGTPPRVAHFIQVHDLEHSVRPPLLPEHVFAAAQQRRGHYSVDVLQPCLIRASWQCRSSLYLGHLRRALLAPGCAIGTSHRAVQGPKGGCGAATRPGRRRRLYAVPHPGARTGTRSTARRAPTSR